MVQMIIQRIKNLWKLSAYRFNETAKNYPEMTLPFVKDFPTIQHKLATIIPEEKGDILEQEIKDGEVT